MSYEIIYDKQFVKLPDNKFIPMIYCGSNNCIQFDRSNRGRRERSWFSFSWICGGKQYATAEEILAKVEEERLDLVNKRKDEDDPDPEKSYGYYSSLSIGGSTRRTTFGMYKGLFVTGMKKALTLEQLKEEHIGIELSTYYYYNEKEKVQAKLAEQGIPWLGTQEATSTQHLMELLDLYEKTYTDKVSWSVHFTRNPETSMKYIRRKFFPKTDGKPEYEYVHVDHYFTLEVIWNSIWYYFVKKIRYGIKYTHYPYRRYATEKEAQQVVNRYKGRLGMRVTRIDEQAQVKVLKKKLAQ